MFDFLAGKAVMVLGTIIGVMSISFALYFNYANTKIDNLTIEKTALKAENLILDDKHSKLVERVEELNKNLLALGEKKNEIIVMNEEEKNIFDNHNFDLLLKKKPKLMEKRINKAIANRFKDFEEE